MFHKLGPQQDPCGQPLLRPLSTVRLFADNVHRLSLRKLFVMLYKFLGQLKFINLLRLLSHHALSKAPCTSKLIKATLFLFLRFSSTKSLTVIIASTVLVCGRNPNWFLLSLLVLFMSCMILLMNNFPRTLAAVLIRLIGRNLLTSSEFSFPGLIRVIRVALYHF